MMQTGGVTLTLSLAYLSTLAHQRNREQQARTIRSQALEIQSLIDPIPQPLPPTRSEVAAEQRAAKLEVFKDKWNQEVGGAVRWVQNTDWDEVRDGLEAQAGSLWNKAFGETPSQSAEEAGKVIKSAAARAEDQAGSIASSARGAFDRAKSSARSTEEAAESKILEARLKTKEQARRAGDEVAEAAEDTKSTISSLLERGKDTASALVGRAKSAVGYAGDKVERAIDGETVTAGMGDVKKALHQRYEKSTGVDTRSVEEVLRDRYKPMDKRDNTVLRGL